MRRTACSIASCQQSEAITTRRTSMRLNGEAPHASRAASPIRSRSLRAPAMVRLSAAPKRTTIPCAASSSSSRANAAVGSIAFDAALERSVLMTTSIESLLARDMSMSYICAAVGDDVLSQHAPPIDAVGGVCAMPARRHPDEAGSSRLEDACERHVAILPTTGTAGVPFHAAQSCVVTILYRAPPRPDHAVSMPSIDHEWSAA